MKCAPSNGCTLFVAGMHGQSSCCAEGFVVVIKYTNYNISVDHS